MTAHDVEHSPAGGNTFHNEHSLAAWLIYVSAVVTGHIIGVVIVRLAEAVLGHLG